MAHPDPSAERSPSLVTRRSLLLLGLALASIVAGYLLLSSGSPSAAAVLLVVGYVILFPLALIL
jgi:hypothetical protein